MKATVQRICLGIYAGVNRSGILKLSVARSVFEKAYFQYKKRFEDPFTGFVRRYPGIFREGHVFDVGANIGFTSQVFSEKLGPIAKVHSFEPERINFRSLELLSKRARYRGRILPVFAAVGENSGTIRLWHNESHHADHRVVTLAFGESLTSMGTEARVDVVPLVHLDGYAEKSGILASIDFVKIDVQGFELAVLKGMKQVIESNPSLVIAVEYAPKGLSELGFEPTHVISYLCERGFKLSVLSRQGTLKLVDSDEITRIMSGVHGKGREYIDLIASRQDLELFRK